MHVIQAGDLEAADISPAFVAAYEGGGEKDSENQDARMFEAHVNAFFNLTM
jgi:hypothetical protein